MIDPFSVAFAFTGILVILMALSYFGSLIYQLFRENGLFDPRSIGCLVFVIFILASIHPLTADHALSIFFSVGAVILEAIWGLKTAVMSLCDFSAELPQLASQLRIQICSKLTSDTLPSKRLNNQFLHPRKKMSTDASANERCVTKPRNA